MPDSPYEDDFTVDPAPSQPNPNASDFDEPPQARTLIQSWKPGALLVIATILVFAWFTFDRAQSEKARVAEEEKYLSLVYQVDRINNSITELRRVELSQLLFEEERYEERLAVHVQELNALLQSLPKDKFNIDLQEQINLLAIAGQSYQTLVNDVVDLRNGKATWQQVADAEIALDRTALHIDSFIRNIKDYSFTAMVESNSQTSAINTALIFVAWAAVLALIVIQARNTSSSSQSAAAAQIIRAEHDLLQTYSTEDNLSEDEKLLLLMESIQEVKSLAEQLNTYAEDFEGGNKQNDDLSAAAEEMHNVAVKGDALIDDLETYFAHSSVNGFLAKETFQNEVRPH